ncbi:MAG: hypothetical protein VX768_03080 [Planctomycetota bacterium]|nr:hypothetical protein [Planctomycetota bacterium]
MFGIFHSPKLLISTAEKVAIEKEVLTLAGFFGEDRWRESGIRVPDDLLSGLPGSQEGMVHLFHSLSNLLGLDSERVGLVFSNQHADSVSGVQLVHSDDCSLGEDGRVPDSFRSDVVVGQNLLPESVCGEMVRKLVAAKLVHSGYVDCGYEDIWHCAEVATAFFGLGLFTVNETVSCCQTTSSGTAYFSIVKLGTLNSFGTGYLLALIAWYREQTGLPLEKHLRPDAILSFQRSLDFLQKTNDCLLSDIHLTRLDETASIGTLEAQLKTATAGGRVWLLELLQHRKELPRDVSLIKPTLFQLLGDQDPHVSQLSLHLVFYAESLDSGEIRQLRKIARSSDLWSSAAATNILSCHLSYSDCEAEFTRLLNRFDHAAASNGAQMASRFGVDAASHVGTVCNWIRISLNRCDYDLGRFYALMLRAICEDVEGKLQEHFGADVELMRGARQLLEESHRDPSAWPAGREQRPDSFHDSFSIPAWVSV